MNEDWRVTPPILPIKLELPSQRFAHISPTDDLLVSHPIQLYKSKHMHMDYIHKQPDGKVIKFHKKAGSKKTKAHGVAVSKKEKAEKRQQQKQNERLWLQVKKMQDFIKSFDYLSQEASLPRTQVECLKVNYAKQDKKHYKSYLDPQIIEHQDKSTMYVSTKRPSTHRRGKSEVLRRQKFVHAPRRTKIMMKNCVSNITSLASLDYSKLPSSELQVDESAYCVSEIPNNVRQSLWEPDELQLRISLDTQEIKQHSTIHNSQKDEGEPKPTEQSTNTIIKKYIQQGQFLNNADLYSEGSSVIDTKFNLFEGESDQQYFLPNQSQEKIVGSGGADVWRQRLLGKVEAMLGQINFIETFTQLQKNQEENNMEQRLQVQVDSSQESLPTSNSSGLSRLIFWEQNLRRSSDDKWVGTLTKNTEIANIDKFLSDRMRDLMLEGKNSLYLSEASHKNVNKSSIKWVELEYEMAKKAQASISKGIRKVRAILSDQINLPSSLLKVRQKTNSKSYKDLKYKSRAKPIADCQSTCRKDPPELVRNQSDDSNSITPWKFLSSQRQLGDSSNLNGSLESEHSSSSALNIDLMMIASDRELELLQSILGLLLAEFLQQIQQSGGNKLVFKNVAKAFSKTTPKGEYRSSNKRKGFGLGPKEISSFLIFLITNIFKDEKGIEAKKQIMRNISYPAGPAILELLKYMRQYDGYHEPSEESQEDKAGFILQLRLFQELSPLYIAAYDFGIFFDNEQHEARRVQFLKSALHIQNKAIFDSLNETMEKYRPYGLLGKPYPWKPQLTRSLMNEEAIEEIMKRCCQYVSLISKYMCGLMLDLGSIYNLQENEIFYIRQQKMSRFLCTDIEEQEQRWRFIDDEETQLLISLSSQIFTQLVIESINETPLLSR